MGRNVGIVRLAVVALVASWRGRVALEAGRGFEETADGPEMSTGALLDVEEEESCDTMSGLRLAEPSRSLDVGSFGSVVAVVDSIVVVVVAVIDSRSMEFPVWGYSENFMLVSLSTRKTQPYDGIRGRYFWVLYS